MLPYDDEGPLAYGRRGALGGQNDGRHPAKPARSCGSMPHRGIDCCATPQCKHPPLQNSSQPKGPLWEGAPPKAVGERAFD